MRARVSGGRREEGRGRRENEARTIDSAGKGANEETGERENGARKHGGQRRGREQGKGSLEGREEAPRGHAVRRARLGKTIDVRESRADTRAAYP